jgi:hypothetical protein
MLNYEVHSEHSFFILKNLNKREQPPSLFYESTFDLRWRYKKNR